MILSFHPCIDADVQIVLGDRSIDSGIRDLIGRADAVILPQACAQNLYELCVAATVPVFPNYDVRVRYPGKIGQARLFRCMSLPHPKTFTWESVRQFKDAFPTLETIPHAMPFLIKEDQRHEAEGVFLIETGEGLPAALDCLARRETHGLRGFVTQEVIPCEGNVLRAVIAGKQIITYWKRPRQPGQWITTISRGALIDHDWRPDLQEKGRVWTRVLTERTGINLAAVDMVFPMTEIDPEPSFLEINYYFGRRGLDGTEAYYQLLYEAIRDWLEGVGMSAESIRLV